MGPDVGLLEEDPLPPLSPPLTANWVDKAHFLQKVYSGRLTCGTSRAPETAERRSWAAWRWGPSPANSGQRRLSAFKHSQPHRMPAPLFSPPAPRWERSRGQVPPSVQLHGAARCQLWLSTTVAGAALGNRASLNRETKRMVMCEWHFTCVGSFPPLLVRRREVVRSREGPQAAPYPAFLVFCAQNSEVLGNKGIGSLPHPEGPSRKEWRAASERVQRASRRTGSPRSPWLSLQHLRGGQLCSQAEA